MNINRNLAHTLAMIVAIGGSPAWGDTLPAATFLWGTQAGVSNHQDPPGQSDSQSGSGTGTFTSSATGDGSAVGTVTLTAIPSITANISGSLGCVGSCVFASLGSLANGTLDYFIELVGPAAASGFSIPVLVEAHGTATTSSGSFALATFQMSNGSNPLSYGAASENGSVGFDGLPGSFDLFETFSLLVNTPLHISLQAIANGSASTTHLWSSYSATAFVDPQFTIDPAFAGDYSLQISAGIGAAAVPGPIVGAGIPGLVMAVGGFFVWRRRKA